MNDSTSEKEFLWIGNSLAIDFVNTLIRHDGPPIELLEAPEDFAQWLRLAGLRDGEAYAGADALPPAVWEQASAAARGFRSLLREALLPQGIRSPLPAPLLRRTNELLSQPGRVQQLANSPEGRFTMESRWIQRSSDDLLRPLAASLAELLVHRDLKRLRKCRNPKCILYFHDTSKSGTRAWCSLDICGDKLRIAAFRKRKSTRSQAAQFGSEAFGESGSKPV